MVDKIKGWLYLLKLEIQSQIIVRQLGYKNMKEFDESFEENDIQMTNEEIEQSYNKLVERLKREGLWKEDA